VDEAKRTRIVIDLEMGSDPITGRVVDDDDDDERAFIGWLALVRELERAVQSPSKRPHGD
jgi:hypothetical protein